MTPSEAWDYRSASQKMRDRFRLEELRVGEEREFDYKLAREAQLAVLALRNKYPTRRFLIRARKSDGGLAWVMREA